MCKSAKDSRSHIKVLKEHRKEKKKMYINKSVVLSTVISLLLYLLKGREPLLSRSQKSQCRLNGAYYSE